MTDRALVDDIFFTRTGMDRSRVESAVADALRGMEDGELFLEHRQSESLTFDDGKSSQYANGACQLSCVRVTLPLVDLAGGWAGHR